MRNLFMICFMFTTISISVFAEEYNCREYKNIDVSKKDRTKYSFDKEKELFYKKEIFSIKDKKIVIEHYDYEGVLNKNDNFVIKVLDVNNSFLLKKDLNHKHIYKFQAIKKGQEIILILNVANKEGSNIEIVSFDTVLNFNNIYKTEGRNGFFDQHDSFTIGGIEMTSKDDFVVAIQLSIFHSAKFTKNYADFVILYKFDNNNTLQWKKDLEIPYDTQYKESENNMVYIKGNNFYRPLLYNRFTNIEEINGCYLIYNDIFNLYGYFAIDSDGYFWTKDPNTTKEVKDFLYSSNKKNKELNQKDWLSFIGFLLLLTSYLIYKKRKSNV